LFLPFDLFQKTMIAEASGGKDALSLKDFLGKNCSQDKTNA